MKVYKKIIHTRISINDYGCSMLGVGSTTLAFTTGTGKFVMAGGGWGIEAMLNLQDYGMPFTLYSHTLGTEHLVNGDVSDDHDFNNILVNTIAAGVYTTAGANAMGCNVLGWSTSTENSTNVYNAILDGGKLGGHTCRRRQSPQGLDDRQCHGQFGEARELHCLALWHYIY